MRQFLQIQPNSSLVFVSLPSSCFGFCVLFLFRQQQINFHVCTKFLLSIIMVVHYTHDNHHHAKKNVSVYDDKNIWLYCIVETNNNYLSSINVSEKGTKFHCFNVCFYKSWNTCCILIFPSKAFPTTVCAKLE